jgi:hypothetical protein
MHQRVTISRHFDQFLVKERLMRSRRFMVPIAVAAVVAAVVLSVTSGAGATATAPPSPSTIYQALLPQQELNLGTQASPTTILTSPTLPVSSYHVEVTVGASLAGLSAVCSLQTADTDDSIAANQGEATAGTSGTDVYQYANTMLFINGTVTITEAKDQVRVVCYANASSPPTSYVTTASLTAQPVTKIKG